ncbi:cytochrome c oxidase assembly protein [Terriglobus albidus]|uniref:cytochrome c oxidase assembly protein n=1 Tax=Terriglobus albidus TaxID=1592106 RepID=UPI0021DFBD96|nr:cytochrome c oxidase assembly protein [Terriglobus albidus]
MPASSIGAFVFLLHAMHDADGNSAEALPAPDDLWALHHWTFELSIILPLLLMGSWYLRGALRRRNHSILRWRHLAFASGWLSLVFALVSPLHQLGDALFSAHMLQHEILILIAAPLIAASHCSVTFLYALPRMHRKRVGALISGIERNPLVCLLTAPLSAWLIHAAALWGWHIPALYQATVRSDVIHAVQHLTFFLTGLIFWSALYGAGRSSMSYGMATLYTFGTAVHCSALGALLTFSTVLWYPIYTERTQIWHLTALEDQQLGGLLMWVPSGLVFIAIGVLLFAKWLHTSDRRLLHTSMAPASARKEAA